jgi:hypothetical protein
MEEDGERVPVNIDSCQDACSREDFPSTILLGEIETRPDLPYYIRNRGLDTLFYSARDSFVQNTGQLPPITARHGISKATSTFL